VQTKGLKPVRDHLVKSDKTRIAGVLHEKHVKAGIDVVIFAAFPIVLCHNHLVVEGLELHKLRSGYTITKKSPCSSGKTSMNIE
jgi:hypothetical protein